MKSELRIRAKRRRIFGYAEECELQESQLSYSGDFWVENGSLSSGNALYWSISQEDVVKHMPKIKGFGD